MENMVRPAVQEEVEAFGKDHGLIHEVVVTGRKVGAGREFWSKLHDNEDLFRRVVRFVDSDGDAQAAASVEAVEAPAIIIRPTGLGRDYFYADDWQSLPGVKLTDEQRDLIPAIPWDDDLLLSPCPWNKKKRIGETHYGFLGLSSVEIGGGGSELLNLLKLQKLFPANQQPKFASYVPKSWYSQQDFAKLISLGFRYYLLLRDIVPKSENKAFSKQEKMLPAEYEVPLAVVETAKDLLHYKKTGKYVNPQRYARTSDLDSNGNRVDVGVCVARGVDVDNHWGDDPYDSVGVGASRKFETSLAV